MVLEDLVWRLQLQDARGRAVLWPRSGSHHLWLGSNRGSSLVSRRQNAESSAGFSISVATDTVGSFDLDGSGNRTRGVGRRSEPISINLMPWQQATDDGTALKTGGATDWRLASIEELQTAFKHDLQRDVTLHGLGAWSSTTDGGLAAWGFNFKLPAAAIRPPHCAVLLLGRDVFASCPAGFQALLWAERGSDPERSEFLHRK